MTTIILQLDPSKLGNPAADIRYVLPDLIVGRLKGAAVAAAPCLLLFLQTDGDDAGAVAVSIVALLRNERVLENDLSGVPVAIEDGTGELRVVHPPGFRGTFHGRRAE
jgi:hypothetical protein